MQENKNVVSVSYYNKYAKPVSLLTDAIRSTDRNIVRDSWVKDGTAVIIGQIELAVPNVSHTSLSGDHYFIVTSNTPSNTNEVDHATRVAKVMLEMVPNAKLYSTTLYKENLYTFGFFQNIEWLIDQGVQVINMSAGFFSKEICGVYDTRAKWIDHIAIEHSVHFVGAVGDSIESQCSNRTVLSPHMAYNAIGVGAIDENNTSSIEPSYNNIERNDDTHSLFTSYKETQEYYVNKPNISAPGVNINFEGYATPRSGTSYAAPQVTGLIAQMIQADPSLAYYQNTMQAILYAGTGTYRTANDYKNNVSELEGVGVIDALQTHWVVRNGRYQSAKLYNSNFPYNVKFYASQSEPTVRVALTWLKQNFEHVDEDPRPISDLNLEIYDPNGNLVTSSESSNNNYEIVEFDPQMDGSYTIKVIGNNLQNF